MIGWRKNTRATEHSFWPRNLIFGLSDPCDMRKKTLFFSKFSFLPFLLAFFDVFPYITLVSFGFHATGHRFPPRNMIFRVREPCTFTKWRLLIFSEHFIFLRLKGSFSDFFAIWDIHGMLFICNNYDGNKYVLFQQPLVQGAQLKRKFRQFSRDL